MAELFGAKLTLEFLVFLVMLFKVLSRSLRRCVPLPTLLAWVVTARMYPLPVLCEAALPFEIAAT